MNNIRAYLQGGLGNQCFIYATARALALSAGAELTLDLDYLVEDFIYQRKLSLEPFNCAFDVAPMSCKVARSAELIRYKLLRDRFNKIGNLCIDKRPYKFSALPLAWNGTLILDGYWQSEKYFYSCREQLIKDFQLKDKSWLEDDPVARQIRSVEDSIFLHVRSYKETPGMGDGQCALRMINYYKNALKYMADKIKGGTIFVFSDDLAWAREKIVAPIAGESGFKFVYVEPIESKVSGQIRDFILMRMCKHGIVADSSFSWWAGWLGEQDRLLKGENPIRIHVNRCVMNDDFWPERWIAI